jgi:folate/biopterin transporter
MEKHSNENEVIKYRNKTSYMLVAFHHGASFISHLAVQYFFKDQLHIEPHELAEINSIIHIPWAIKPLLGLLTDFVPIFGYRRKIYIILCGIVNLFSWFYMTYYANTVFQATAMMLLVNFSLSYSTVLGEAVVVELSKAESTDKDSKAKDYVSLFFLSRTLGEILSSYFKGLFVDIMPLRQIFFIAMFVPIMLIFAGFILVEEPVNKRRHALADEEEVNPLAVESQQAPKRGATFKDFINFFFQGYVLIPLMFIIVFKATPNYHDSFFYFITNDLKLSATELGKIAFCSTIAILIAILIYKQYLKQCNFKFMILLGTFVSFFISLMSLLLVLRINIHYGISDFWILLLSSSFLSLIGELVLLPMLSLACVLCPKNLEGTIYSVFMSTLNLGGILSNMNGAILTKALSITSKDYTNLHWLIIISKVSSLLPLPMLLCIDNKYFHPELNNDNEKQEKNDIDIKKQDIESDVNDKTDVVEHNEIKNYKTIE